MLRNLQMRSRRAKVELLCAKLSPTASTLALDVGTGTGEGGAFFELYPFPRVRHWHGHLVLERSEGSFETRRSRRRQRLPTSVPGRCLRSGYVQRRHRAFAERGDAAGVRQRGPTSRKSFFVTTPNKWFPIELHYRFFLFQFLPRRAQKWLNRHFNLGFVRRGDWLDVKLLSSAELRTLFPDARVVKQCIHVHGPETSTIALAAIPCWNGVREKPRPRKNPPSRPSQSPRP